MAAFTDDAETVGIVDVEDRVVRPGDCQQLGQRRCVAGHTVHAVDTHQPWVGGARPQQLIQLAGILGIEVPQGATSCPRYGAAVVDCVVRMSVEKDRAFSDESRNDRHMDVRDRGNREAVFGTEELGEFFFDLGEQPWMGDHT